MRLKFIAARSKELAIKRRCIYVVNAGVEIKGQLQLEAAGSDLHVGAFWSLFK